MTSKIKVDNINKVSDDSNIINKCGTTITLGASGDSIALASGASQTGFGRTGTVDWQTTPKTATFTAESGKGYFCNTTAGSFEVDLPTGSSGDIVSVQDYNNTFDSNSLIVDPPAGQKINGGTNGGKITLDTEGEGVTLVYVDSTVGWRSIHQSSFADVGADAQFISATGGTITTVCTNFKVHTFTGPGTFCVSCGGNAEGSNTVSYLVVAGGAGGAGSQPNYTAGGGGGAGGFREGRTTTCSYTVSPLNAPAGLPVTAQGYPITVGGGGNGGSGYGTRGSDGNNSIFSTITSEGGGGGGIYPGLNGNPGGSGGGGGGFDGTGAGSGNTPPVSPAQGTDGGTGRGPQSSSVAGGGGGGATVAGTNSPGAGTGGAGGTGATSSINATPTARAGGGGGGSGTGGAGGTGGGGAGVPFASAPGTAGTTNTGGGGGGVGGDGSSPSNVKIGGAGGSGIVMIRYKFQ
jgi:hypothetical protein